MNCVSCDICVYHLGLSVFLPGLFLSSRVTGACPVTTDLIMRVNVKTTTMAAETICNQALSPSFLHHTASSTHLLQVSVRRCYHTPWGITLPR